MEKRYQVFISSTFQDLKEERQSALRAILELDHMPAGMELFPAVDDDAWQLIRDVIDDSDYYVLIIGGRYGSQDEVGISYTEREYAYAISQKTPVIAVLHQNPDNLPRERTETDAKAWEKLKAFRVKVERAHTCVYWTTPEDLKSKVLSSLVAQTKRSPRVGWVRADKLTSSEAVQEILTLRNQVAELQARLSASTLEPPPGTEDLSQGSDFFDAEISYTTRDKKASAYDDSSDLFYTGALVAVSWDDLFAAVAPRLIDEAADANLRKAIAAYIVSTAERVIEVQKAHRGKRVLDIKAASSTIDTCIVQFRALGLIVQSSRKRAARLIGTFWTLTPYGDSRMVQLRALRRDAPAVSSGLSEGDATSSGDEDEEVDDQEDAAVEESEDDAGALESEED